NVSMLPIRIAQQRDERRTIWVVLDRFDLGGNAGFVAAEIDHAVMLLVSASTMANGKLAVVVTAIDPVLFVQQRLERLIGRQVLLVIDDGLEAKRVGY